MLGFHKKQIQPSLKCQHEFINIIAISELKIYDIIKEYNDITKISYPFQDQVIDKPTKNIIC